MQNNYKRNIIKYHGSNMLAVIVFATVLLAFIFQCVAIGQDKLPAQAGLFGIIFSALTLITYILYYFFHRLDTGFCFTTLYLLSMFTLLISWRISAIYKIGMVEYLFLMAFIAKLDNYFVCAFNDLNAQHKKGRNNAVHASRYEWQLFFIRMAIGFVLVPHFTEKLFAGPLPRIDDVVAFTMLGVPHPLTFVYASGVIEMLCCFAIGCGFLTRLGAVGAFFYLMVATFLGHHFSLGFIWASQGGGWEYPALWAVLMLSFVFFGADSFSLDGALKSKFAAIPKWVKVLMG